MNKKAQEKIISIWNIIVIIIITIVIAGVILLYNNGTVNSKDVEAKTLGKKILNCLTEDEELIQEINENFSLYETCGINPDLFEEKRELFAEITILDEENNELASKDFGNSDLYFNCAIQSEKPTGCFSQTVFIIKDYELFQLKIETVSNHDGTRVK